MTESLVGGAAAAPLSMRATASRHLRRRQGRATSFPRSRTRPSHRCRCPAQRDGGRLRRLRRDGAWDWKTAYDACEVATVLFLRKFGPAMRAQSRLAGRHAADAGEDRGPASDPHPPLRGERGASSNSRRRFRSASRHAPRPAITPADLVLEPSAGTGLLAILAELAGGVARSQRARRDPRRLARHSLSRHLPSRASTPRRSTIISTPASSRASC